MTNKMANKTAMTHIIEIMRSRAAFVWLATAVAVLVLAACGLDETEDSAQDTPNQTTHATMYDGTWKVGAKQSVTSLSAITQSQIAMNVLPCADIMAEFFPEADPTTAECTADSRQLTCSLTSTTGGTLLYSIQPTTWEISAIAGGERHYVSLTFAPTAGGADDISWATVSKSGVLTLILHATATSIDGGGIKPVSLTLTYTATRK